MLRNGLRIMAVRALCDEDLAEDVAQEALYRALRAVSADVAADPVRLGAYVGGIARHLIADARRARARTAETTEPVPDLADPLSSLVRAEVRGLVASALEELKPHERELLVAFYYEDLSAADMAAAKNRPVVNVRKQKSRALQRLRIALESRLGLVRE